MAKKINIDECAEYSAYYKKPKKEAKENRTKQIVFIVAAALLADGYNAYVVFCRRIRYGNAGQKTF